MRDRLSYQLIVSRWDEIYDFWEIEFTKSNEAESCKPPTDRDAIQAKPLRGDGGLELVNLGHFRDFLWKW